MSEKFKFKKRWDYEDDHDFDSNVDYKALGYGYWYGKYIPQEQIDKLKKNKKSRTGIKSLLALGVIVGGVYGILELASTVRFKYKKRKEKISSH